MQKGDEFQQLFVVDEAVYSTFIKTFKDKNPLHISDEYARQKGFLSKVMHGNILNGFVSFMIGECLPAKNVILQTQTIKYLLPVYLNDEIVMKARIEDVYESVNCVELSFVFFRETKKVAKGIVTFGII